MTKCEGENKSSSNLIRSSGSSTADTNDSAEFTLDLGLENKEFNKLNFVTETQSNVNIIITNGKL